MDYFRLTARNERLEKAWQRFVKEGIIDNEIVRPDIAHSWHRCIKQKHSAGEDSMLPPQVLEQKRQSNKELIQAARPVMLDTARILKNSLDRFSVLLLDRDGDIIDRVNEGTDILCLGHRCSEVHAGTTAGALALINGAGVEVVGYEHLYPYAHQWHTIGVPVHDNKNSIIGVFGLLNTEGPCPPLTMQMVSLGAQLIETRLNRDQMFLNFTGALMDKIDHPALVIDDGGYIIEANKKVGDFFNIRTEKLPGHHISRFISGTSEWGKFISADDRTEGIFRLNINEIKQTEYLCRVTKMAVNPDALSSINVLTFQPLRPIAKETCKHIPSLSAFDTLIGHNPQFVRVIDAARRAAPLKSTILIEGESGTGKELLARAIHEASGRQGLFVAINCGSMPRELLLSELFGYEEGAFTGARRGGNPGKFELAHGGTLFLDEIGEMPPDMQVSLLRFLEDKTVVRIGGHQARKVDVRIIAATNRSLSEEVKKGCFREDLYYRLHVIYLCILPLRERRDDIPALTDYLLTRICERNQLERPAIDEQTISLLCRHDWPGNVRELQNVLESSLVLNGGKTLTPDSLPDDLVLKLGAENEERSQISSKDLKDYEYLLITETLNRYNGNISKTARALGISRTTLYNKLDSMGLKNCRRSKNCVPSSSKSLKAGVGGEQLS